MRSSLNKDESIEEQRREKFAAQYGFDNPQSYKKRKMIEQTKVYLITYLAYAIMHF